MVTFPPLKHPGAGLQLCRARPIGQPWGLPGLCQEAGSALGGCFFEQSLLLPRPLTPLTFIPQFILETSLFDEKQCLFADFRVGVLPYQGVQELTLCWGRVQAWAKCPELSSAASYQNLGTQSPEKAHSGLPATADLPSTESWFSCLVTLGLRFRALTVIFLPEHTLFVTPGLNWKI